MLPGNTKKLILFLFCIVLVIQFYFNSWRLKLSEEELLLQVRQRFKGDSRGISCDDHEDRIVLIGVVCGDEPHIQEFLTMMQHYAAAYNHAFTYEIQRATHVYDDMQFVNKRGPLTCSMQRMYLPNLLPNINKVLYVDGDIIFLKDLADIWGQFKLMNSSQICGIAVDDTNVEDNFYRRRITEYPFYGPAGINTGVILMDLKKLREENWVNRMTVIAEKYKSKLLLPDQDIANVFFHDNPDKLFLLPTKYHFNTYNCLYPGSACKDCKTEGVAIVHGFLGTFRKRNDECAKTPICLVYQAFRNHKVGSDPYEYLVKPLQRQLDALDNGTCANLMRDAVRKMCTTIKC